jgi:hypothetical protein
VGEWLFATLFIYIMQVIVLVNLSMHVGSTIISPHVLYLSAEPHNSMGIWLFVFSTPSCEIVALRKNFVVGLESYDSNGVRSCVFLVHENVWAVLHLFPLFLTQSGQKKMHQKII